MKQVFYFVLILIVTMFAIATLLGGVFANADTSGAIYWPLILAGLLLLFIDGYLISKLAPLLPKIIKKGR